MPSSWWQQRHHRRARCRLDLAIRGVASVRWVPQASAARPLGGSSFTSIAKEFTDRLVAAYKQVPIGDPMDNSTLMGPLMMTQSRCTPRPRGHQGEGGEILCGGSVIDRPGSYVTPNVVRIRTWRSSSTAFVPILYVFE